MDVLVEANTKDVETLFRVFPARMKNALADGMDHATRSFYAKFYKERLQGSPGIRHSRGGIFHRFRRTVLVNGKRVFMRQQARQGESTRAIARSADDPLDMKVELYTQSDVAGMHERGGVISSGKGMPIPLNQTAREMLKNRSAMDGLAVIRINGKVFLGRKREGGKPELLFILKRAVRIRPRLGFYSTWDAHDQRREEIMLQALNQSMEKL